MDYTIATGTTAIGSGDGPPATGTAGEFTDGDPATNTQATVLPAYQMNAIVEEIIAVIKAAGLTPDRTNTAQLLGAINDLRTADFPSSLAVSGYKKYPDPNSPSGYFIEQWGYFSTYSGAPAQVAVTFPVTFPSTALNIGAVINNSTVSIGGLSVYNLTTSGFAFGQSYIGGQSATYSVYWTAKGY